MGSFFAFTRIAFGWDWFIGPAKHHDGRRRTTKTLAVFTRFARITALGNALLLALNYTVFANAVYPFLPESLDFAFPSELDNAFALGTFKSWVQSQLCIQSLSQIHRGIVRIADADN